MKKIALSFISVIILFAAGSLSFTMYTGPINPIVPIDAVRYLVNINLVAEKPLCNKYVVVITDANGVRVAPVQTYVMGKKEYIFYERGPAMGTRVAGVIPAKDVGHLACQTDLFAYPAVLQGPFWSGNKYIFDLYPQFTPLKQ
jgi:hypothetical protein